MGKFNQQLKRIRMLLPIKRFTFYEIILNQRTSAIQHSEFSDIGGKAILINSYMFQGMYRNRFSVTFRNVFSNLISGTRPACCGQA